MLQNELFLKEISDFLRSCTVKNKYFAQMTANQVMDRYNLSNLPDYYNPYYLHLFGLSTLDLQIPDYLVDEETGARTINQDRRYKPICGKEPEMTEVMVLRLDRYADGTTKIDHGISAVEDNLAVAYLNVLEYDEGIPTYTDILNLDGVPSKVNSLKKYMEEFIPKDDRVVTNLITGEYDWRDLITNSPVYNGSNVSIITTRDYIAGLSSSEGFAVGWLAHVTSEQKTYRYAGIDTSTGYEVWNPVKLDTMLDETIAYFRTTYGITTNQVIFVTSYSFPSVETLGVIGELNWDDMYGMGEKAIQLTRENIDAYVGQVYPICETINGVYTEAIVKNTLEFSHLNYYLMPDHFKAHYETLQQTDGYIHPPSSVDDNGRASVDSKFGPLIDVDYDNINTSLGYNSSNLPKAGTRVNYISNSRAWKYVDASNNIDMHYYTRHVLTEADLNSSCIYTDSACTKLLINGDNTPVVVSTLDGLGNTLSMQFTLDGEAYSLTRDVENDTTLRHCTYEFSGTAWVEVSLYTLFREEWKYQWNKRLGAKKKLSYTLMSNASDKEHFNEKLIWRKNNIEPSEIAIMELDRWNYTSWDTPIYVPTYDYKNKLTDDFTLYTRLCNNMRASHIRTSLKYFIGAKLYDEVLEANPTNMDFIKGIFYPVINLSEIHLNIAYAIGDNGVQIKTATVADYNAYRTAIQEAMDTAIIEYKNHTPVAPNFSLLRYDSSLLQEQEAETVIDALRKTLTLYRERFDVKEFGYEELYYAAVWATIWSQLPMTLLAQRIKNLRTEAVHKTHIWEFLKSRGLGEYRTVLDNAQQIFLYKNIDYLRGNEGKQRTIQILSDKLLSKFSAEIRTKSVLLDTTNMPDNEVAEDNVLGKHLINGLTHSVSGAIKGLSEDLDEVSAVISDTTGRIEDFDDLYRREYVSGLVPKYGDSLKEQQQRVSTSHDEIEVKKHSYAPTKLAEITRGKIMEDLTRISMSFIIQTLARKLSGSEISNKCIVNAQFEGLGEPKTFTVGECLALIFYAIRKRDWYTFYSKLGDQNFSKKDIWKGVSNIPSDEARVALINSLSTFSSCPKSSSVTYESDCDHSFYNANDTFNDSIPSCASVWLPYLGNYENLNGDVVELELPLTYNAILARVGNPKIYMRGPTMRTRAAVKNLLNIVSPYQYKSETLLSWNDMCAAEDTVEANNRSYDYLNWNITKRNFETVLANMPDNVKVKYDSAQEVYLRETLTFTPVGDTTIGGLLTGSTTRLESDNWYMKQIPFPETLINSHADLIDFLNGQVESYINHFLMVRGSSDYYFHEAIRKIYDMIRVNDVVALHLVDGFTTFSEWFDSDVELKSAFREIEAGTNQVSIYNSVVDNLVSALFPEDKISSSAGIDLTKYNAIKRLFQEMCSYNIAFLNTSSVSYECLYLSPITINCHREFGNNIRYKYQNNKATYTGIGRYYDLLEHWTTTNFNPKKHIDNISIRSPESRYLVECSSTDEGAFAWVEDESNTKYYKWITSYNVPTTTVSYLEPANSGEIQNTLILDQTKIYLLTASNIASMIGKVRYLSDSPYGPFEYRAITVDDVDRYVTRYHLTGSFNYKEQIISNSNTWSGSTWIYEPTTDLTFQEGTIYYLKKGVEYLAASVVEGEAIPFNNRSGAEETEDERKARYNSYKESYLVLGSEQDTQVYYIRRAV